MPSAPMPIVETGPSSAPPPRRRQQRAVLSELWGDNATIGTSALSVVTQDGPESKHLATPQHDDEWSWWSRIPIPGESSVATSGDWVLVRASVRLFDGSRTMLMRE